LRAGSLLAAKPAPDGLAALTGLNRFLILKPAPDGPESLPDFQINNVQYSEVFRGQKQEVILSRILTP
jgi:hypothetical protein